MGFDYKTREPNYEKFPTTKIEGHAHVGYAQICEEIKKKAPRIVVVDAYIGADVEEIREGFVQGLSPDHVICADDIFYDGDILTEKMEVYLTDDRVRGVMYYGQMMDFVVRDKLAKMQSKLAQMDGTVLIYGVGASLITRGDILLFSDMARWEIQLRYRDGMPNFRAKNYDEDILRKYKRGYFIEWRIADKHKRTLFEEADFWLDMNQRNEPKMIDRETFMRSIETVSRSPFRVVPYFDPGVWGGQWMKQVCDLPKEEENYAWSFDGVPEENSLLFDYNGTVFEMPSVNAILHRPEGLLGKSVYDRFGGVFPIRFDFLDTFEGQNLSLQVHPTLDFARENYGMQYTQEESYYILDAEPDAKVYLGLKNGADKEKMFEELEEAQAGGEPFDAEKYANTFSAKTHDHFLIPPGTLHCSGTDVMVLEISTSAYIFTFKLWDWGRLGLDGLPRPIHLEEGKAVLNFEYDTDYTKKHLVNQFETISDENGVHVEKTGLHPREYIETVRYTMKQISVHDTEGNVNMLNLVGGEEAIVESPNHSFEPLVIHYAETFIVPADAGEYTIRPYGKSEGKEVKVLKAYVRKQEELR